MYVVCIIVLCLFGCLECYVVCRMQNQRPSQCSVISVHPHFWRKHPACGGHRLGFQRRSSTWRGGGLPFELDPPTPSQDPRLCMCFLRVHHPLCFLGSHGGSPWSRVRSSLASAHQPLPSHTFGYSIPGTSTHPQPMVHHDVGWFPLSNMGHMGSTGVRPYHAGNTRWSNQPSLKRRVWRHSAI